MKGVPTFDQLATANDSGKVTTTTRRVELPSATTASTFIQQVTRVRHGHRIAGFGSISPIARFDRAFRNTHALQPKCRKRQTHTPRAYLAGRGSPGVNPRTRGTARAEPL